MRVRAAARLVAVVAVSLSMTVLPAGPGSAGPPSAGIRLLSVVPHVTATRFAGDPTLFVPGGVYVAATNGPFELDAISSNGHVTVYPTSRGGKVAHGSALLTPSPVQITEGLPEFFQLALTDSDGLPVSSSTMPFCPGGYYGAARVDDTGPLQPTFPYFCGSPLTQGAVWGIDKGWASPLFLGLDGTGVADGDYTLKVSVSPGYATQLGLADAARSVTVDLTVVTDAGEPCPPDIPCAVASTSAARRASASEGPTAGPHGVVPAEHGGTKANRGVGGLPNLKALPAHDLLTETTDGRDYLDFGATIWNAGPGPFVVEGFRVGAADVMAGTQYIYKNGVPTRQAPTGQFEYDRREGHNHWHFENAAQYDLLNAAGQRVLLSGKQSFCLAPTDPIDLTLPGAEWQPDRLGLWSACAGEDSIWLREVMPAGWGDTYFQGVAGQSFDITDLPNGHYQLRVTTDPLHTIRETSYDDNAALLPVDLGGDPGARTVTAG